MPETLHWFSAGDEGAVISEFSTKSTDETDVFTDKNIVRAAVIEEN
jgi:D-lyxose ketol-isomerase